MSLQTQLNSFVLRVADEFNTVKGRTGNLAVAKTLGAGAKTPATGTESIRFI